jgi:hypothetical protein
MRSAHRLKTGDGIGPVGSGGAGGVVGGGVGGASSSHSPKLTNRHIYD